jgi:O-antigen/teichoic acid export membrane protein
MEKPGYRFLKFSIFKSEFVRHSFLLFLGSAIAQSLSVALYPVFSRMYSPEQFGVFALFTSITGVTAILSSGFYEQAILLPKKDSHAWSLALLAFIVTLMQCLIFLFIAFFFKHAIAEKLFNNPQIRPFLLLVPVSVLLGNTYAIFTGYANRKKYYGYISQCSINQGISVNISKLFLGLLKYFNCGLVLGRLIGQLTSTIQVIYQVSKKASFTSHDLKLAYRNLKEVAVSYRNFPVFRMPLSLMNTFSTALPIFVLTKFFTAHDAGQYSLASGVLLAPVLLLTGSVSKVLNQKIIERINQQAAVYDNIARLLRIVMPVTGIIFILFFFVSEGVFVFLFGHEWQEAGKISGILLPWIFLMLFASPISFVLDIFFKQKKALIIDAVYLVLRMIAMAIGVYYSNMFLAIKLFVLSGCIVLTYNFIWYLSLLKKYDKSRKTI